MKKIFYAILLIALSPLIPQAQEVGLKWSKEEKINTKSSAPGFMGIKDGLVYVLKSSNPTNVGGYYVEIFDETSLDSKLKIDFKKLFPKDMADNDLDNAYLLSDKIIVISTDKKELYASSLDLKGKMIKPKILIDKVEGKDKREFEGFDVYLSPDRNKILGIRKGKGKEKDKNSIAYNFTVYDGELKRIVESKQYLPYSDLDLSLLNVKVDDKGDAFCVARIRMKGARKKFDTYKSVLMSIELSKPKPELNEVNLPFEKRIASSLSFIMKENKMICTGLYAGNKDADYLDGVFYIELDKSNFSVITATYEKFKPGLESRKNNTKKMEKNVDFDYVLKSIYTNEKNEKFLVFEHRSVYYVTSQSGNTTRTTKFTQLTDIIVAKLNADNKLEWNTLINKNQIIGVPYASGSGIGFVTVSSNGIYKFYKKYEDLLSYVVLYKGDKLYFVFNDNVKNIKTKTTDKAFNNYKKCYSALVTLDTEKGKWEKKAIFNAKEAKRAITPNNSVQISDSKILTFSLMKKNACMGYMTID